MESVSIWRMDKVEKAPVFFRAMEKGFSPYVLNDGGKPGRRRGEVCVICHALFQAGDMLVICCSNDILFPNCFIHAACLEQDTHVGTARHLRDSWAEAQQYAHWF